MTLQIVLQSNAKKHGQTYPHLRFHCTDKCIEQCRKNTGFVYIDSNGNKEKQSEIATECVTGNSIHDGIDIIQYLSFYPNEVFCNHK